MADRKFVRKLNILELIEEMEIIGRMSLVDNFDISYSGAARRIYRLQKAGLIEPLGIERGKWVLSVKGYDHLDFLRRRAKTNEECRNQGFKNMIARLCRRYEPLLSWVFFHPTRDTSAPLCCGAGVVFQLHCSTRMTP